MTEQRHKIASWRKAKQIYQFDRTNVGIKFSQIQSRQSLRTNTKVKLTIYLLFEPNMTTAQTTRNAITLRGSAAIISEYLSMYLMKKTP